MKFTIKDKRFIQRNDIILDYIKGSCDEDINKMLLKSLSNISKVVENKTEFDFVEDYFDGYLLVKNNSIGAILVREDNVNAIIETNDILDGYDIHKVIRNGDKTILITHDNDKFITTRQKEDEYDLEKAVMILLLKKEGYSVNDIYSIINSVK